MIQEELKKTIEKAIGERAVLEHPANPEHGDYSTSVALVLATKLDKNPRAIAEELVSKIRSEKSKLFDRVEIAGPGFINFFLSRECLFNELTSILREKEKYGRRKMKGTVVIDYSGPNIAKPFGVGHLRSTIIGQVLYNLHAFLGYKTIGDNHIGDWGTQFGKLLYQIKKEGLEKGDLSIQQLEELYVRFHQEAEHDETMEEGARAWFKKLEDGDTEARQIWKKARDTSLKEFEHIYKLLEVKIDNTLGESFYEPILKNVVEEVKKKGLAKKSRGAWIVEFPNEELPPAILLKSDEATNYFTRDLATIQYRLKKWKPNLILYEVGAEQSLYLKQLFWTAELLGWAKRERFHHVAHGLYRTKEGKFSTRKGQTVHLEEVLEDAINRAREIIEQSETARGLPTKEKETVAKAVGIGAVKFNDLLQNPSGDIVFDWDKMLNLKGNSAPYLQYTYARAKSILRKSNLARPSYSHLGPAKFEKEEMDVLRYMYRFPEIVAEAAKLFSPNLVAQFAVELAQKYNAFYNKLPVLQAETEEQKQFRLTLTSSVAQLLQNSLHLLGIETLERM